ncbi:MAG: hypothetical protein F6K10_04845 [Moorea sp. SIO2B7]|nr:hypothetical protein [Moorena sp. SIO2B7]
MIVNHRPDPQSELSVFVKTPEGRVYSSAKACSSLINASSVAVNNFAVETGNEPEVTLNIHLANQVITVGLFDERFVLDLIRHHKPKAAPDLSDFSLRTYLWVCAGFDADAVIKSVVDQVFDEAEKDAAVDCDNGGGITPTGIKAIYQQEGQ